LNRIRYHATGPANGGAEGGRTPDLLIANEALSQLSYGPARCSRARLIAASAGHLGLGIEGVKDRQGTRRRGDSSAVVLVYVASPRYILCTILRSESQSMRALFLVIDLALEIYIWILIAAAVFSWLIAFNVVNVRNSIVGSIGDFLYRITEPALRPIRNFMPNLGGIDISPVILILIIIFIRYCIALYILPYVF
jgi:YggT family protein